MTMVQRTLALLAALLLFGACSGSGDEHSSAPTAQLSLEDFSERGQHAVGVRSFDLVDATRSTVPNGDFPGAAERAIPVEVWYPAIAPLSAAESRDADLDLSAAPYPLIIFAHGYSSFARQSASYAQHLASHGYVVASPTFPSSRAGAPGGPRLSAVLEQPADVSFVIDTLVAYSDEASHALSGAIESGGVGMTGHSLGGLTTLLTAYGETRDERVRAIVPISAPGCFVPPAISAGAEVPAMVMGGSMDLLVNPRSIRAGYDASSIPRYWIGIAGGDHIRFADTDVTDSQLPGVVAALSGGQESLVREAVAIAGATGADVVTCTLRDQPPADELISGDRQRALLRVYATTFFAAHLRGDAAAQAFLRDELPQQTPEVRFEFEQ